MSWGLISKLQMLQEAFFAVSHNVSMDTQYKLTKERWIEFENWPTDIKKAPLGASFSCLIPECSNPGSDDTPNN